MPTMEQDSYGKMLPRFADERHHITGYRLQVVLRDEETRNVPLVHPTCAVSVYPPCAIALQLAEIIVF